MGRFVDAISLLAADSDSGVFDDVEYYSTWPYSWSLWIGLLVVLVAIVYLLSRWSFGAINSSAKRNVLVLRLILVALIAVLLLGWTRQEHATDLPDLIVIVDNSRSMTVMDLVSSSSSDDDDTALDRWTATALWLTDAKGELALLEDWQNRYRLRVYLASDRLEGLFGGDEASWRESLAPLQPDGMSTQLGKSLDTALRLHRGRPIAGVVFITDGVTTLGPSLGSSAERARQRNIPLFVVAAGADSNMKNLAITDALASDTSFVGDHVTVRYSLQLENCVGDEIEVIIKDRSTDEVLASDSYIAADVSEMKNQISFVPNESGTNELLLEVIAVDGETTTDDNIYPLSVNVRDDPIRVLLVDSEPRFEFRAISDLLQRARHPESDDQHVFEVSHVLQSSGQVELENAIYRSVFPASDDELFEFDVVILGDADPQWLGESAMASLATFVTERGGGLIICAGQRFMPSEFANTALATLVPFDIDSTSRITSDDDFINSKSISLTDLGAGTGQLQMAAQRNRTKRLWEQMPGLYWWLETESIKPGVQSLVHINEDGIDQPVISQSFVGAGRVVFHFTDETWRWRGHEEGESLFNRYWIQSIRELCRSELLGRTRSAELTSDRSVTLFGNAIQLRLRYLDGQQIPSTNKVLVSLERENGIKRTVTLDRLLNSPEIFAASINQLTVGDWTARVASPVFSGGAPECRFSVTRPDGEMSRTSPDRQDMVAAAEITRGHYYEWRDRDNLDADLPEGRRVPVDSKPPVSLWNHALVPTVLFVLLSMEWVLRRRIDATHSD